MSAYTISIPVNTQELLGGNAHGKASSLSVDVSVSAKDEAEAAAKIAAAISKLVREVDLANLAAGLGAA